MRNQAAGVNSILLCRSVRQVPSSKPGIDHVALKFACINQHGAGTCCGDRRVYPPGQGHSALRMSKGTRKTLHKSSACTSVLS